MPHFKTFPLEDAWPSDSGPKITPPASPGATFALEDAWEVGAFPQPEVPPEPEVDGPPGRFMSNVGAAAQGYSNVATGVARQSVVPASRNDRALLQIFDRIDETGQPVPIQETGQYGLSTMSYPLVDIYSRSTPEERLKIRGPLGTGDPRDNPIYRAAERVQGAVAKALPVDPARADKIESKLFGGAGSLAGFITAGIIGRFTGTGTLVTGGIVGSRAAGDEAFQDALASGASLEDATRSSVMMERVGFGEVLPIAKALDRFDRASGGQARKWIGRMISVGVGGIEEGLQEGLAQMIQNFVASGIVKFDEERQVFEGVGENAGIGFTLGALMSFLAEAAGGRRARGRQGAEATPPVVGPVEGPPEAPMGPPEAPMGPPEAPMGPPEAPPGRGFTEGPPTTLPDGRPIPTTPGVAVEDATPEGYGPDDGPTVIVPPEAPPATPRDTTGKPQRPKKRATYLSDYLHAMGGIQNQGNELGHMGLDARPGMINKNGLSLDEAAYLAWEAGFLPEFTERPSIEEFLEILRDDFNGLTRRFHPDDADLVYQEEYHNQLVEQADRLGIVTVKPNGRAMSAKELQATIDSIMNDPGDPRAMELSKLPKPRRATVDQTEQGEQRVIPGAERITDKDLFERRMKGRKQATVPQKGAEAGGLFDEGAAEQGTQSDLDLSRAQPSIERAQEGPGENYVGFLTTADTKMPGEIPPIKGAVSREDVIRPLLAALGHRVFEGRKHFKVEAEGFFRKPGREVRVKKHGDIEVTLHELAHLIDNLDPEIGKAYRSKEFKLQIRGVSYEKTKLNEGFAEFVRLWSTQRQRVKERAPEFTDWFERYLDRQPWGKAFRESADLAHKWFSQESALRVISKFGTPDDINAGKKRRGERFRQNVFDDLEALKRAELTLFGEVLPMGFYESARLTRGVGAVVDGAMKWGAPKILPDGRWIFVDKNGESATNWNKATGEIEDNPNYTPWGLRTLLNPIWKHRREWGIYAFGRRAEVLKREGRENLLDASDIRTMLAFGDKYPEFEAVFQDYQKFNKQVLDFGEQTGIINREGRKTWETDVYIPMWRVSAEKKGRPAAYQKGLPGFTNMIVRLRGGTQNLRDPIQNIFENMQRMVEAGTMNHTKRYAINTISKTPGGGAILAKISTDSKQVTALTESVAKTMQAALAENSQAKATEAVEAGEDPAAALEAMQEQQQADRETMFDIYSRMPAFMKVLQPGIAPEGSDIHVHMENGRPIFTQVLDPLTYRALATLPRSKSVHIIMRMLKTSRRLMQMSITISFNFAFRNIARDQFMGASLSRYGYKPGIDAIRGMRSRVMQDALFKEMMANGGGIAGFWSQDHQSNGKLAKFYGSQGISYRNVLNAPAKMFRALEHIVDAFESATRLGEARMGIKKGAHPREVALAMREVSTDFAMRGDNQTLGYLYDSILFLKAGTVGVDRLYRGMVQDKHRRRAWTWAAGIGLASMGLHLINMGNPLYDDLEDWDRHSSWHFYIPNARYFSFLVQHGREPKTRREALPLYEHFRMPKPFELGGLGSIAEETISLIAGQYSGAEYGEQIRKIIMDMFRFDYLPGALRPLMDVKSNELSFFNVPIESQSIEQLQKWARYGPRTSQTMQAYGNYALRNLPKSVLNAKLVPSPAQLEALIRGYTNAWGLYGLTLADAVFFDDTPDIRTNQIPGLSVFYRQDRGGRTKYSNMFYELVRESVEARRTMVAMDRANRPDWAEKLAASRENLEYEQMGLAGKEARAIGNQLKAVQLAKGLEGTRALAVEWGKDRNRRDYFVGLRKSKKWNDVGALKSELLTYWIEVRNDLFELVVKDIEAQRDAPMIRQ